MGFIRSFIRRNMNPMTKEQAARGKFRLSVAYYFITWNALSYIIYTLAKSSWPENNDEVGYLQILNSKDSTVYKYSGFKLQKTFDYKRGEKFNERLENNEKDEEKDEFLEQE